MSIYGLANTEWHIFSSDLVNTAGKVIDANNIRFDNEVVHPLTNIRENEWKTVEVLVDEDALKAGAYKGSFIISGQSVYSLPVTAETPPLLAIAIMLIIVGVALSIAMWEGVKHFKNSVDRSEATKLQDESRQAIDAADNRLEDYNRKILALEGYRLAGMSTRAARAAINQSYNRWVSVRSKAEVMQRSAANAQNRLERYRARLSRRLPVAARIGIVQLASAAVGIAIALFAMLNNDFLNGLRVIDPTDALILIGLGLGIGSLKEFIDK